MAIHADAHKIVAILVFFLFYNAISAMDSSDAAILTELKSSVVFPAAFWTEEDPCEWTGIGCSTEGRVLRIQISGRSSGGKLPSNLGKLTKMEHLELQNNNISGELPTLRGLGYLRVLILSYNNFHSIPLDFFDGMTSLISASLDYNPLGLWRIPSGLQNSSSLQNFSAVASGITGSLPGFFNSEIFPSLANLHLSFNNMEGDLPPSFSGLSLQSIWLNGQRSTARFTGSIDVLRNMSSLTEAWLHSNSFTGPLPDFSSLQNLQILSLRDNLFTGPVPPSLMSLPSLRTLNLTNNLLQGPLPVFKKGVSVDMANGSNRFCLNQPGDCDPRVDTLISVAESMNYPRKLAEGWDGDSPCDGTWLGVACSGGNITTISFQKMGLTGTISPSFGSLLALQQLILSDNNLTGTIPAELADLPSIRRIDVSNNDLYGKLPDFRSSVVVDTSGNKNMGRDVDTVAGNSSTSPANGSGDGGITGGGGSTSKGGVIAASVSAGVIVVSLIGIAAFCLLRRRRKMMGQALHPHCSGSDNESLKITVVGVSADVTGEAQMAESGSMVIPIHVLRSVTGDFDSGNVLGRGGFGTVYRGELHDGTKIAVKRMEAGVIAGKGLSEFRSEIAVLTKVRHRNLVSLLGYCLDGAEKLLVYEYMPQGTLSRHLFNWAEEGLRPLEWTRRLIIALDVARGVEYLHSLAHQSFIHRDLKPSNILLGDDMRAKVSDFGLVRLAPEGKASVETRIAGTFGYLAPEYAVTGRVTTKADVYSFGVILMELITGRRALDEERPEESMHLVTWFRRMHINNDTFNKAMDPALDTSEEETVESIATVAELAGHCCTREPYQRPEMGHAVNVLSSLVDRWKPSCNQTSSSSYDDLYGIDFEMSLPQAVKRWQQLEGTTFASTHHAPPLTNVENTHTSIPSRPCGFANSFKSEDGR